MIQNEPYNVFVMPNTLAINQGNRFLCITNLRSRVATLDEVLDGLVLSDELFLHRTPYDLKHKKADPLNIRQNKLAIIQNKKD
jgi:hypothetical protein